MRVTFDTNQLLDIKNCTGDMASLTQLLKFNTAKLITICIPATAASENQPSGGPLDEYSRFSALVSSLPIDRYEELIPMSYMDMTYYDRGLWVGQEQVELEHKIHDILFHEVEYDYVDYIATRSQPVTKCLDPRWRNIKCDVQAMWCHIYYGSDVFVTEDGNFHKAPKKPKLIELGARRILTSRECVQLIRASSGV